MGAVAEERASRRVHFAAVGVEIGDLAAIDRQQYRAGNAQQRVQLRVADQSQRPAVSLQQPAERRQEADEVAQSPWEENQQTAHRHHRLAQNA